MKVNTYQNMEEFAQKIPKIELHLHLDGSLSEGDKFFKEFIFKIFCKQNFIFKLKLEPFFGHFEDFLKEMNTF